LAQSSRTTFAKRQKEQARKEKARMKAEKRQQKKSEPGARETDFMDQDGNPIYLDEAGNPISDASWRMAGYGPNGAAIPGSFHTDQQQSELFLQCSKIGSSKDAYEILKAELLDIPHEEFWILLLNRANRVIKKNQIMCIFSDYISQQEDLKGMQKEIIVVSKNYNNELKLFQKGNIIDSYNAEKVKLKYDELQNANKKIVEKQEQLETTEKEIQKLTDQYIGKLDQHLAHKEKEIIADDRSDNRHLLARGGKHSIFREFVKA